MALRRTLLNQTWRNSLLLALGFLAGAAQAQAPTGTAPTAMQLPAGVSQPPLATVRDVPETFFGTTVHDPYRWLEDTKSDESQRWMKAQSQVTREVLDRIPGRAALFKRLLELDESVPARVVQVMRQPGDAWYYERRGLQDNQFKLYARQGLNGKERLLVDPEALEKKTGKPHAINYFDVSPDNRVLAYGLSEQGSEAALLHRLDLKTGRPIGQAISRGEYGGTSFTPDGRQFSFIRLQEMKPGMAPTDKYLNASVWLLGVREPVEKARRIFGRGMPGVDISPEETPAVNFTHDGRWALGYVINGVQREFQLYVSPAAAARAGKPTWKKLFDRSADITGAQYMGDRLYLLTHKDAPRYRLLALDLRQPDLRQAVEIVPTSDRVLSGVAAAADALYLEMRVGNVKRLFKQAYPAAGQKPSALALTEVPLPVAGSFTLNGDEGAVGASNPLLPGLVLDLQGWTRARQVVAVGADGQVTNTGLQPQGPLDAPQDWVATEVLVPSHDGVKVPMSVLHKKGIRLDGNNPTLVYGYGSYGMTEEPYFSVSRMAWLDAGGVIAFVNPRGSGVFGREWHEGGRKTTKPNTWKDTIACTEWLVSQGYTRPAKLGIWGGSAGGILVGRAITERPDLYAVAVPQVGALDGIRFETTPNGIPNIPEFGTRTTEEGFRALLAMSTYHQIQDGVKYPAVLLTHGVNDPRVEVWESTKTAARIQAASASGKPVLLRLDWDAGHGIGNTKKQMMEERADVFSFLLWQMGVEAFQPK